MFVLKNDRKFYIGEHVRINPLIEVDTYIEGYLYTVKMSKLKGLVLTVSLKKTERTFNEVEGSGAVGYTYVHVYGLKHNDVNLFYSWPEDLLIPAYANNNELIDLLEHTLL